MVGWRDVPVDLTGLGKTVIGTMPVIRQAIVASNLSIRDQDAFERKILAIRKQILNNLRTLADKRNMPSLTELYMPSFSTRTVVYKGLLLATQVGTFYRDLANPLTTSALALAHQAVALAQKQGMDDLHVAEYQDTLGWVQYQQGDYPDAEQNILQAANVLPREAEIRYHLGLVYAAQGNMAAARSELGHAVLLAQGYAAAQQALDSLPKDSLPSSGAAGTPLKSAGAVTR